MDYQKAAVAIRQGDKHPTPGVIYKNDEPQKTGKSVILRNKFNAQILDYGKVTVKLVFLQSCVACPTFATIKKSVLKSFGF